MKVAFDVDDTIWKVERDSSGKALRQVPDYDLIGVLRWFFQNGDEVYVWSAGGMDYARVVVEKLGLSEMVTVIPKGMYGESSSGRIIDLAFDDETVKLGITNVRVTRKNNELDT